MNIFKKFIHFIFRKRIAELKAKKIADSYELRTEKVIIKKSNKLPKKVKTNKKVNLAEISKKHHQYYLKDLRGFKKTGIKKVELICIDDCECCKDIKNKKIPLSEIRELPMKECPLELCRGRYCAVVEFDLS